MSDEALMDIDIDQVAVLARLELSAEEREVLGGQLRSILEHVDQLSAVDTEGIEATRHPLPLAAAAGGRRRRAPLPRRGSGQRPGERRVLLRRPEGRLMADLPLGPQSPVSELARRFRREP